MLKSNRRLSLTQNLVLAGCGIIAIKMNYQKIKRKRLIISATLLICSIALTLYCRFFLGIEVVFTHFFYIPIILVSIWWGYWGLVTSLGLGLVLVISHFFTGSSNFVEDLMRAFFLIVVSYLSALVSTGEKRLIGNLQESEKIIQIRESVIHLLSHQLLSPLTSIRWTSELLQKTKEGETSKKNELLKQINVLTKKAIDLINDFLSLNRIELGKVKLSIKKTDVVALLDKIISEKEEELKNKKQNLSFRKSAPVIDMESDIVLLRQIFENMLSNAIKYTPEGGNISITIKELKKEVQFEISDTGYGIPKAEQNKIFEIFFRASNIRKLEIAGTGLGLSIVKSLTEFCGGRVWLKSKEGKGTTFFLVLPI